MKGGSVDLKNLRFLTNGDILGEEDIEQICEYEEESNRKGNFKRIFPLKDNVDTYSKFFEAPRRANVLLWAYIRSNCPRNILYKAQHIPTITSSKSPTRSRKVPGGSVLGMPILTNQRKE